MSDIDHLLFEAWRRLSARVRADRAEALRRARRRLTDALTRPVRPWCLCIRANDTRIREGSHALFTPTGAQHHGVPHVVRMPGVMLRMLTAPVHIPWPGIDWVRAADQLGRTTEGVRDLIDRGVLQSYSAPPRLVGSRGKMVPFVWAHGALDPNMRGGRGPHEAWGTLWQWLHERVPEHGQVTFWRVPLRWDGVKPGGGERFDRQWRWQFVCRGVDGKSCHRGVSKLYLPIAVWTLAEAVGEDPLEATGIAVRDRPVEREGRGERGGVVNLRFACAECHRVWHAGMATRDGWNRLVTHVSGGLLRGEDVPCPAELRALRGKRRGAAPNRTRRPAPRRAEALRLAAAGLKRREIAARMGITFGTVQSHLRKAYLLHGISCPRGVNRRAELCAKAGLKLLKKAPRLRVQVARLAAAGLTNEEIATRMGVKVYSVTNRLFRLYKEHGVHSRRALVEKLRRGARVGA